MEKEIGKIYETKNYNIFKLYEWNRQISKSTLRKLKKSYDVNGWKKVPIIVDERFGIVDGQHRYMFAKENNLPIYFMIIKGITRNDCQIMNSARTGWTAKDYIHFYAIQKKPSYVMLNSLLNTYSNLNLGIIVYATSNLLQGQASTTKIINGTYECTENQYFSAIKVLDFLTKSEEYINKIKGRKTQLCQAIIFALRNVEIDNERLAVKLKENYNSFNPPVDMETALSELERIYNYKLKDRDKRVYLVTEWKKRK